MLQMLQSAPRAENVVARSYAVYMPSMFCAAWSTAVSTGPGSLEADIPPSRIPHNEKALKRIGERCSEYKGLGIDKLRGPVIAGLKAENAPLALLLSNAGGSPEKDRIQLARVLADYDASGLQPLAMIWPLMNTDRLAATLPDELKPYAQGIVTAAFDIALCREGAYCGTGSVALDMVCLKFAECGEVDVENAYRRLHNATGISFDETSKMAEWIRNAIQHRDANALWPNTAGWPRSRK